MYVLYWVLKFFGGIAFTILYFPRRINRRNIPRKGPVILAGNHTGNFDAATMLHGSYRVVHTLAKKELFSNKIKSIFFRSMGCISVDRSIHDEKAKVEAIEVLKKGKVLGIFPEGTVNITDKILLPFKYGAVSFAQKTGAPIVPFAITGKYKLFRRSIKITYGEPYYVKDDLDKENKILMNKVKELIKNEEKK